METYLYIIVTLIFLVLSALAFYDIKEGEKYKRIIKVQENVIQDYETRMLAVEQIRLNQKVIIEKLKEDIQFVTDHHAEMKKQCSLTFIENTELKKQIEKFKSN